MDMSREQRLAELETAFAHVTVSPAGSPEELVRAEQTRAARHFGFAQPSFRTSVRLRFSGDGVQGHDLSGGVAGNVIAGFTGAVEATGTQLHLLPSATQLFLSPNVTAGSTVLEMFGAPAAPTERLDTEIDDTPVDAAIGKLFAILNDVNRATVNPSTISPIEGQLGKRLFSLVKNLLDGDVDLDLIWTRPRGNTTSTSLNRSASRALRDLLDVETLQLKERRERGTLASISTAGLIGLIVDGKKTVIPISAPDSDAESLRALWAKPVEVIWMETVVSHPQREDKKVSHELISIREVSGTDR